MKSELHPQAGLSLIEVVISLSLSMLLLTAASQLLQVSLAAWTVGSERVESRQNSRLALAAVLNEIRYARSIIFPTGNTTDCRQLIIINSTGTQVSFQLGTSGGNGAQTLYRSVGIVDNPLTENRLSAIRFTVDHAAAGQPAIVTAVLIPDLSVEENGQILRGSVACPNIE